MKFAIMAPGRIAATMAYAVNGLLQVEKYAVASRDLNRAKEFAKRWGFEKAYGSYAELLQDPEVELIYVASPHSHHYEHAKMCLMHGKNVLVEKSFTVNAKQAKELVELAKDKGLLLAEAIWTRYMPSRKMIDDIVESGVIGKVTSLTANLGYMLLDKERLLKPELAGGALLDVGVYTINFALMAVHDEVEKIDTSVVMTEGGVDAVNSITLTFRNGVMAVLHSSMVSNTDREGIIYGDKGYIKVYNINNCEGIKVFSPNHELVAAYEVPKQINGFEYEVLACMESIKKGQTECMEMPHSEILRVMEIMDYVRNKWGFVLPCE